MAICLWVLVPGSSAVRIQNGFSQLASAQENGTVHTNFTGKYAHLKSELKYISVSTEQPLLLKGSWKNDPILFLEYSEIELFILVTRFKKHVLSILT